jgi:hypothetical protein
MRMSPVAPVTLSKVTRIPPVQPEAPHCWQAVVQVPLSA